MRADDKRKQYLENLLEGPTKDSIQVVDPVFSASLSCTFKPGAASPPHTDVERRNGHNATRTMDASGIHASTAAVHGW
jgi:hypothetical protein